MIFLTVFAFGSLVCCWGWGDVSGRTKWALTTIYAASWGLLFIPYHALYLFPLSQCAFAIGVGWLTFGVEWLMRDMNHWR